MKIHTLKWSLIGLTTSMTLTIASCGNQEELKGEEEDIEFVGNPTAGSGGIPSDENQAVAVTTGEAVLAVGSLNTSVQGLTLDMSSSESSAGAALTEGGCEGLFCLVNGFSGIFDTVTGAAQCNFKLLATNPDGTAKDLKQIDGKNIFYIDGLGTVGIGDQGKAECPDHATVVDWGKKSDLIEGESSETHGEDDFYPPTRLVFFKTQTGDFKWKIVFFPTDLMDALTERLPHLSVLAGEKLDFEAFHGSHSEGTAVGEGEGEVTLDFDELVRMMSLFENLEQEQQSTGNNSGGGMPAGKIEIEYNMTEDPTQFTTTFLDGFTFGDSEGEDNPFTIGKPTSIYKADNGENYMHFITGQSFGRPDPDSTEDGGPMDAVQYCTNPDFGQQDGGGPFIGIKYRDILEADYDSDEPESHIQVLWKSVDDPAATEPNDFIVNLTTTKGGAYKFGDVNFQIGKKAGSTSESIRLNIPKCEALTAEKLTEANDFMKQYGGLTVDYFDEDGYVNVSTEANGNGQILSKDQILEQYPAFTKFKLIEVQSGDDPIIKE